MAKLAVSLFVVAILTAGAYTVAPAVIGGGALDPQVAKASDTGYYPPVRSCWSAWYRSGHHYPGPYGSNRWYHCHTTAGTSYKYWRVHVCYTNGFLHAVTVRRNGGDSYNISVYDHAHAWQGEGC